MADILKPKKCMCGNKVIPRYTGMAWQIKCDKCGRSVGAWGCAEAINKWNRQSEWFGGQKRG